MGNFEDYDTAFQVRKAVRGVAEGAIDRRRPASRYAIVKTIDESDRSVGVVFVGDEDDNIVRVPYNSIKPSAIGQAVKIGGTAGDRVVEDTRGPDDDEYRLDYLAEKTVRAYASSWLPNDYGMATSPVKIPFNNAPGMPPFNITVEGDGSHLISTPGDYMFSGQWCSNTYRNASINLWVAVLPNGGAQYDLQSSFQTLLGASGEYVEATPIPFSGMAYLNAGDRIYVNGMATAGGIVGLIGGSRFILNLINPDPIVR